MLLIFRKITDQQDISVNIKFEEKEEEFSYPRMLEIILSGESLEESVFDGEFSKDEIASVNKMTKEITEAVQEKLPEETASDDIFEEDSTAPIEAEPISVPEPPAAEDLPF